MAQRINWQKDREKYLSKDMDAFTADMDRHLNSERVSSFTKWQGLWAVTSSGRVGDVRKVHTKTGNVSWVVLTQELTPVMFRFRLAKSSEIPE